MPPVIRVEKGYPISRCLANAGVTRRRKPFVLLIDVNNPLAEALRDLSRVVGRTVVHHYNFVDGPRLRQGTVDRTAKITSVVIGWDHHAGAHAGNYYSAGSFLSLLKRL